MRQVAILPALALVGAAPITDADMGPAPSWEQATSVGESAVRDRMKDPESALIEWPYQFVGGTLKPAFGKTRAGYWTCGYVNAKNSYGGYAGRTPFMIMVRYGQVTLLDIGQGTDVTIASVACRDAIKKGQLKPAPFRQTQPVAAATPGPLGLLLAATPYGAMIVTVAPGSIAEKAGLRTGEVIEAVNGIPIKGMGAPEMSAAVAAPAAATFSLVGVGDVKVR